MSYTPCPQVSFFEPSQLDQHCKSYRHFAESQHTMAAYKEINYVEHDNGEVTPVKVTTHDLHNLVEGTVQIQVHIDMSADPVVDLTYMDDETIASDEEDNDDNGDGSSWPSKVNSGTSFIFEESIFYDSGDDGSNRYNDFYIQCTESHDDSVVSRLTTEEDDMCLRCLECAGRGNGGWMHCLDCYHFHYRA